MLDISPIVNGWVIPFLTVLLGGVVIWIIYKTGSLLPAWIDANTRQKITAMEEKALDAGMQYVLAWVQREGAQVHPQINSWLVREGAQIALNHASGILKDNNADPEVLANQILAKLPPSAVTTDVNAAIKLPPEYTATVNTAPLPPIATK